MLDLLSASVLFFLFLGVSVASKPNEWLRRNGLDNVAMEWIASGLVDDAQLLGDSFHLVAVGVGDAFALGDVFV